MFFFFITNFKKKKPGAASCVINEQLYIFGGYAGTSRLNDLWYFDFTKKFWTQVEFERGTGPGPRENNGLIPFNDKLYLYGGYNGVSWLQDFHEFDLIKKKWRTIENKGVIPGSRFGFVSILDELRCELIVFAGYDGKAWLNDMYAYSFQTKEWYRKEQKGEIPSIRSCPSWAKADHSVYMFGGYDGIQRMNDFYEFDIRTNTWYVVKQRGSTPPPSPRYFHASVIVKNLFLVYGGFSGQDRLRDLYAFDLNTHRWVVLTPKVALWGGRSSLVAQVFKDQTFFIFGGYNGSQVLNDLVEMKFDAFFNAEHNTDGEKETEQQAVGTFLGDVQSLVNNKELCDVCFYVEGRPVYAVGAILAVRSEHFRTLLYGGLRESRNRENIVIEDARYDVFFCVVEYLMTGRIKQKLNEDVAMEVLITAEKYLLGELKEICSDVIRKKIQVENVVRIILTSYRHNAESLKNLCLEFIVNHLDHVKNSKDFVELKKEPDLLIEILMKSS